MNLKQIGLARSIFATDYQGAMVEQVFTNSTVLDSRHTWTYFQVLSNELQTATVLLCGSDRARPMIPPDNFNLGTNANSKSLSTHGNLAVSYFLNPEAGYGDPSVIVAGDRNLAADRLSPAYSSVAVGGPTTVSQASQWSIHTNNPLHGESGNLLNGDGSVWTLADNQRLKSRLDATATALGTNRIRFLFPQ